MWKLTSFSDLTVEELYGILQLRTDVFVVEQECPYPEVDGNDAVCQHLFYEENGEILAYLRILPAGVPFEEPSIGRVVVKQATRGRGLARPMMQQAIAFIYDTWKADRIKISAQTYLADFYTSLGFEAVSDMYLEDGIPHMDMLHQKN